jgi:hypothetical protein
MEVLHRIRKQRPDVFDKLEGQSIVPVPIIVFIILQINPVYIDGGITRGTGDLTSSLRPNQ